MKKNIISLGCSTLLLLSPAFVLAADILVDNDGTGGSGLQNPLNTPDITSFLLSLLRILEIFAVPLIIFMIIYAGFMYVTAQGNETIVSNAHKALLYAVIGGVIIIGAEAILAVIQGTVNAF